MIYNSIYNHNLVQQIYFRNNFSSSKVLTIHRSVLKEDEAKACEHDEGLSWGTCIWDGNTNAVTPQTSIFSSQTIRGRNSSHTICWGGNEHTDDEKVQNNVGKTTFQALTHWIWMCAPLQTEYLMRKALSDFMIDKRMLMIHTSRTQLHSLFAKLKWESSLNLGFTKMLELSGVQTAGKPLAEQEVMWQEAA